MVKLSGVEQDVLNILNRSLSNFYRAPQNVKDAILDPDLLGPAKMKRANAPIENFTIGLIYCLGESRKSNETNISGIILDSLGIGYISGIKSDIAGFQGLKFKRHVLGLSGKFEDTSQLWYECATPIANTNEYEGVIIGSRADGSRIGKFELIKGKQDKNNSLHEALEHYYDSFIERFQNEEVLGVKNG
jgi:hypothetical protein